MPEVPALVWANGRPMIRSQLTQRVSGPTVMGVRSILTGHPAQNLNPGKLAAILRQAEQGDTDAYLELAEEMEEKDLHYLAVLKKRKEAIAQLPIKVVPAGEDAEAKADAELIEEFLERDELQDEIIDMLDAIGKGWSVTEIVWERSADKWLPAALERSDQRFFEFDRTDGVTLYLRGGAGQEGGGGQPEPLAAAKYIVHRAPAKSGITARGGIARAAAWHYMFKNFAWKDWVSFLETYGMPIRVGRYDNGETEENKRTLLNALAMLGSDAAAAFPKTMEIEFIDGKAGTAPSALWRELIANCDDYLSKLVLGQTNTTDAKAGGLGSGQANVHKAVEETIERSDARRLATTLNRDLVKPIVMLNRGMRTKWPKLKIGHDDPVDVAALVDAASTLVPMGVRVSRKKMAEAAGLPEAEDDDDLLLAPAAQSAMEMEPGADGNDPGNSPPQKRPTKPLNGSGGLPDQKPGRSPSYRVLRGPNRASKPDGATASAQSPQRDPDFITPTGLERADFIDATTEEALSDWEELMDGLLAPVDSLLASASSIEDVRDRLVDALEEMDAAALTAILEKGGFAGHLQGEFDVQDETT